MPKTRSVIKVKGKTYSLRCSSQSIVSLSLPEDVLEHLKEKHDLKTLRKWAKTVLLRESVRYGLIEKPLALALARRGLLRLVVSKSVRESQSDAA